MPEPVKWRNWYDEIINLMIAHPEMRQKDMAEKLKVTQGWLSQVINTDMFKDKLRQRVGDHAELVSRSTIELAENVGRMTLVAMEERLEADVEGKIPFSELRENADMVLSKLGYGNPKAPAAPPAPQVNLTVNQQVLEQARGMIRNAQQQPVVEGDQPGGLIDITPEPVPAPAE